MKTFKKLLPVLIAVLLVACTLPEVVHASGYYLSLGFKYSIDEEDNAIIKSYYLEDSSVTEIEVPKTLSTKAGPHPVTTLLSGAFSKTRTPGLEKILLPESVETIEEGAIPQGITVVRNYDNEETVYEYVQGKSTAGVTDDGFLYKEEEGKVTITGYEGRELKITVPSEVGGTRVTALAPEAFMGLKVNEINVPAGVEVGKDALAGNYKVVLDYDTDSPTVINDRPEVPSEEEPSETESVTETEPTEESTTVAPTKATTDPTKATTVPATPDQGSEKKLDTAGIIVIVAALVVLAAAAVAIVVVIRRMESPGAKKRRRRKKKRAAEKKPAAKQEKKPAEKQEK